MGRGIECGDGWYAILDGLCEVVSIHGRQTGHSLIEFAQVKEKLAELRIYTDGKCEWCRGAIDFAERFSRHICEETGRPGVLMAGSGGLRTLAEDVGSAKKYRRYQPNAGVVFDEHPQPRESLPKGWRAIASALMTSAAYAMPDVVLRFGHADGELQVDCPSPTETI